MDKLIKLSQRNKNLICELIEIEHNKMTKYQEREIDENIEKIDYYMTLKKISDKSYQEIYDRLIETKKINDTTMKDEMYKYAIDRLDWKISWKMKSQLHNIT